KRVNAIYRAEDITNDVLEAAKFALQENKYVKLDDLIVEKIQFIDQFRNREWEYLSGDARVPYMSDPDLKKFPNCDRLTTDVSEKANWNTEAVDIRFQDGAILVGVTTSSSYRYNADNNTYVLTENGYKGADYTVTLTDRGTMVIQAERNDGTVYECEYQPAD
ncbi:MAG: hypothetical protein J6E42_03675, partial [Firmicutes bacterium]|nr:hypothetical protein [Bacillota bacterium]